MQPHCMIELTRSSGVWSRLLVVEWQARLEGGAVGVSAVHDAARETTLGEKMWRNQ